MMKFLLKLIVVLGLILLVAGVIAWQAPAEWLLTRADLPRHDIQYARVSGTVWDGVAHEARWHDLLLGDIQWDFMELNQVSPPFTTWRLEGEGLDYQLSLLADFERDSLRRLHFIQGELPAAWVDLSKVVPLLILDGRLLVNLDYLELKWGNRGLVVGSIEWNDATFTGLFEEKLGDIIINIEWVDGATRVYFHSTQVRNIMLEGEASLTAGRYDALVILHTTEKKRYVIEELANLGEIQADGSLRIERSGKMRR
jgi:hypothetical protein